MRIQLNVPTNLDEITLGQYQRLMAAEAAGEDTAKATAVHICGASEKVAGQLPKKTLEEIRSKVLALFETAGPHKKTFEMDGVKYGFVPNLDNLTFAEFKDIESSQYETENLHTLVGTLYRPVVKEARGLYQIAPYTPDPEHNEKMRGAPVSVAIGTQVFFWNIGRDLLLTTPKFLEAAAAELEPNTSTSKNGAGMLARIHWLAAILPRLTK